MKQKKITKTQHVQYKNPTRFYCKEETKQGYDKKIYPKLVLNKLKVMGKSTFIYTYWALNSRNFQTTCGPCVPMCELRFN
jgi:ATP adenylyltransferase/5',5'''-P-1,P-4-tetraphosphate phosphorylase II